MEPKYWLLTAGHLYGRHQQMSKIDKR
jgi:hypothetical protein